MTFGVFKCCSDFFGCHLGAVVLRNTGLTRKRKGILLSIYMIYVCLRSDFHSKECACQTCPPVIIMILGECWQLQLLTSLQSIYVCLKKESHGCGMVTALLPGAGRNRVLAAKGQPGFWKELALERV